MTIATMMDRGGDATPFFIRSSRYDRHEFMTTSETNGPLWTQDQAIAYEAALEAINDVIAGYSAQIAIERNASPPNIHRMERSEEHTSELQSLMRNSYAVFCLKKKKKKHTS